MRRWMWTPQWVACSGQKRESDSLDRGLQVAVSYGTWMLKTELGSSRKTGKHSYTLSVFPALSNDKEIDATTIKWNTRFGLACEGDEQEMRGSLKNEFYQCSFPGADSFCHCGQERKGHCNLENTSCAGQRASYLPFTALKSSLFYTHSDERETKHVWE